MQQALAATMVKKSTLSEDSEVDLLLMDFAMDDQVSDDDDAFVVTLCT